MYFGQAMKIIRNPAGGVKDKGKRGVAEGKTQWYESPLIKRWQPVIRTHSVTAKGGTESQHEGARLKQKHVQP